MADGKLLLLFFSRDGGGDATHLLLLLTLTKEAVRIGQAVLAYTQLIIILSFINHMANSIHKDSLVLNHYYSSIVATSLATK